jgi:hypothetical protein
VNNWLRARQDVSDLIHRFSVSGILTNLSETLNADGDQLFKRLAIFTKCRDNNGAMVLDKDTEEYIVQRYDRRGAGGLFPHAT